MNPLRAMAAALDAYVEMSKPERAFTLGLLITAVAKCDGLPYLRELLQVGLAELETQEPKFKPAVPQ